MIDAITYFYMIIGVVLLILITISKRYRCLPMYGIVIFSYIVLPLLAIGLEKFAKYIF